MEPYCCQDTTRLPNGMKTLEIIEKMQKKIIKLLISQLFVALNCETWFKIDATTQFLYLVVQYTNDLILLFMNVISENVI